MMIWLEYKKFFKDKSIWIAICFFFLIEVCLQLGCYEKFLNKNSYAAKINNTIKHIIKNKEKLNPDILLVGTSLAYEGISLKELNKRLEKLNLKVQSVAIPGAEMIVQELLLEKALEEFPNVKYIIHINDIQMPWIDYSKPTDSTLAMLSTFNPIKVLQKLKGYEYEFGYVEISYLSLKLIAYRKDFADFILSPLKRLKEIFRANKNPNLSPYFYENSYEESLQSYSFTNLLECKKASQISSPIPKSSGAFHQEAVHKTCALAEESNFIEGETESTQKFYKRLQSFYSIPRKKNIRIFNIFAPLPNHLAKINYHKRIHFWTEHYSDIALENLLDLSDSIPILENEKHYFDMMHLNQKGMQIFTERLADKLISELEKGK
jgi:hypothetical protein